MNRFVGDLKSALSEYADVVHDHEAFWACEDHFDIIHIHECEYLSYEIEACMYNSDPIPARLWTDLERAIAYWRSSGAAIIHTRHVQEPHVRADEEFGLWYRTVMSGCHGVAHFASFSIDQFRKFYPELTDIDHVVIPHQNYSSLPNEVTREQARQFLGIDPGAKVLLVFGMIKEHEKALIQKAYEAIPGLNKVLLAPGWKVRRRDVSWIRLREWIFRIECARASLDREFRTNLGFIEERDAQYFANAADVLLIPRTDELNSGNITFGCTFGLVVVGRSGGDIGEILSEIGNPTFDPGDHDSIARAIEEAFEATKEGLGKINRDRALQDWDLESVAAMYLELYRRAQRMASI